MTCGSSRSSSASSPTFFLAWDTVSEKPGLDGTSFASLSVSEGEKPSTRPTSRITARAFMVPKVMIWPTEAWPYFWRT